MKCPRCGHELAGGILPPRCPYCGKYLTTKDEATGARRAHQRREEAEGLVGFRKYRHFGIGPFIVALVIVLLTLGAFVGIGLRLGLLGAAQVPDVTGWLGERAEEDLEDKGFVVSIVQETSDQTEGYVISTDPTPGSSVARGSLVTLHVAVSRTMPDVVGKSKDEATALLDQQSIPYEVSEQVSDDSSGVILSTSLDAGAKVSESTTVKLVVSIARAVPDVIGKSETEALSSVKAMGLKCAVSYVKPTDGQPEDIVTAVDPDAGTVLGEGDTVTIQVTKNQVDVKTAAADIINIVYNCGDPVSGSTYVIGSELRSHLASTVEVKDQTTGALKPLAEASDLEIWYSVVKQWTQYPITTVEDKQRSIRTLKNDPEYTVDGNVVTVYFQVNWSLSSLGAGYENSTAWDGRTVTLTFDDSGQLLELSDPTGDVSKYGA